MNRLNIKKRVGNSYQHACLLYTSGFIFLSPLYQRYGIRGFCIQDNHAVSFDSIAYGVLVLLLSAGGCTSFELFRRWVVSDKKILELEKATKQAELQQLKKQINPHFLFNMLNNDRNKLIQVFVQLLLISLLIVFFCFFYKFGFITELRLSLAF